ncbi:MAG TPA: glycosyltransferase family 4 protein [Candidatus Dormibacteraeota bacterium]|nr:glycosyltransferase family 4 protein [Candidatus Dormibacteraeota bacterium]
MRILFVCPYLPTPRKRRQLNFVLHLARRHEVHLRVLATAGEMRTVAGSADLVDRLRSSCASLALLPVPLPLVLLRGARHWARGDALRTAYTRAHERWAARLNRDCDSLGIDVVHVDRLRLARLAAAIDRPTVVDLPDCMSWAVEQWASVARGARRLLYREEARRLRRFEGGTLNRCPAALVASEEDARCVRSSGYRGDTHYVPGIIDFLAEGVGVAPPAVDGAPRLVFHGNLFYPPNVDAICSFAREVFPALRAEFPSVVLTIVGASPARRVRRLAGDGIRVVADVEAIAPWLRAATAVIAPMRIGAGHSQKVCEGLLAGRPVICSAHVAQRVDGEVRARLLVARHPGEWVQQVGRLIADPIGAAELGEMGRAAVRASYSAEAVLPLLESVYRRRTAPAPRVGDD